MMENKSGQAPWEMGHFIGFCFYPHPYPPVEGRILIDLDLDLRLPRAL